MARLRLGRDAKVYISASAFTASGLIEVRRGGDITVTDSAKEVVGEARDLEYDVNDVGSKTFGVEMEVLQEADDEGTDIAALEAAYDASSELFVIVANAAKDVASGKAIKFKGKVFDFGTARGLGEHTKRKLVLKNTDPDNPPTRVTTPLA